MNYQKYNLIGLGEFSHGIEESWEYRFSLLKKMMNETSKKITIYQELSIWQGYNIMNNTYYDRETDKVIKSDKIKIENPVHNNKYESAWGKLWQYMMHSSESNICLRIVKYIRKNKNRIKIIGVDNDKLDRDYDMYKIIIKHLKTTHINFFWAHNDHVDNRKLSLNTLKFIENKNHKWTCGHYLKEKLGDKYCIILSTAYNGENRFNSYCIGKYCNERIWQINYFYKKFKYEPNKKYVHINKKVQLLNEFDNGFIEFSNSYYEGNKDGVQRIIKSNTWDFVLFWNNVSKLEPYKSDKI
jgi:hypothetical protein